MPLRGKVFQADKTSDESKTAGIMDSEFIPLDDLVYAPLHALAKSNQQLRAQIVEAIRDMGRAEQNGQEEVIHLNNINIAYDQVRSEQDEGYSVDNLQVQVPLLSIIPVTNLNVDSAEIGFSTEVKAVHNAETDETGIKARICSPSQRESDFLPKVTYNLKIRSITATEGIMRLIDSLSSSQVAKKRDTTPIAVNGEFGSEEQKNTVQEIKQLKGKISRLKLLYKKLSEMMEEQERLYQISKDTFEEDTFEYDKDKYLMAQSNVVNRIMDYQEKVMNMEIRYGLEKDYE